MALFSDRLLSSLILKESLREGQDVVSSKLFIIKDKNSLLSCSVKYI